MSKAIPGMFGKVYHVDGATKTAIGEVRDATLSVEQGEIDVTSFDSDGWSEVMGGLKSWNMDKEMLFVSDDVGQGALYSALVEGSIVEVEFYPKDGAGAKGYSGSALVVSWELGNPLDDGVTVSISLKGTGRLNEITKPLV